MIYKNYFKRPLDFIVSLLTIICLSPVFLILALFIRIKLGSPVIFKQDRVGLNEKVFTMYKFRTMTDEKDKVGKLLADEIRLTKFGKMLRSVSLDELPELFNILKGDMSIVGPRPLLEMYLPYYRENERRRHSVRPGLTGLAQVNGRSFISWEEIFNYDLEYIADIAFIKDLTIIGKTILTALGRENVADVTQAKIDEAGDLHFVVEGKTLVLHRPLHVEREEELNAKRNRQ